MPGNAQTTRDQERRAPITWHRSVDKVERGEPRGDLWVEPGDPEIRGLDKNFDGGKHAGADVKVAACEGSFLEPTMPARISWTGKLSRSQIKKANSLFLVKSSSGRRYVVQITALDTNAKSLTMRCRELR